jgi:hypothetical protein
MRKLILFIFILNSVISFTQTRSNVYGKAFLSDTYIKGQSIRVDTATIGRVPKLINATYYKGQSIRVDTIQFTNTGAGTPFKIINSGDGIGTFNNNPSSGTSRFVSNTGTGKVDSIIHTSPSDAYYISAEGLGTAINVVSGTDNIGIKIQNTVENSNPNLEILNSGAFGSLTTNINTGYGGYILNDSTGTAFKINNEGAGTPLLIDLNGYPNTNTIVDYQKEGTTVYSVDSNGIVHNNPPHAFLSFADSSESFTMASNANWYNVNNGANGIFKWDEKDYIDSLKRDTIKLMYNGHWQFHYHVVFIGTSSNYYNMRLYNVTKAKEIPIRTSTTGQGAGNRVSIGNTAYCTFCQKNDKVVLQMQSEANTNTVTLIDGSILILQTHGD